MTTNDGSSAKSTRSGFAPDDLTDGREKGDWKTRYPDPEAKKWIRIEALYVTGLFILCPIGLLLVWLVDHRQLGFNITEARHTLCIYSYGWVGGLLGGTLFSLKWLYHSVAHTKWHLDRRLWRFFAPHLSGALAFVFICLVQSGIFSIFNTSAIETAPMAIALAFLVGYFSDTSLAKLSDIAYSLFGTTERER